MPIEETAQVLNKILDVGKIRHVRLSNFAQKDVESFMTMIDIDEQQGLYNTFERNTQSYHGIALPYKTEKEMLPIVHKYGQADLSSCPQLAAPAGGCHFDDLRRIFACPSGEKH